MPETVDYDLNQTLSKLLAIIVRRRWWLMLVAGATIGGTVLYMAILPSRYTSQATLLVVQQQVPERFVLPSNTAGIREVLQATTQEVLSRTKLLGIVEEFDLYAQERKRLSAEGVLDLIRRNIEIQPLEAQTSQRELNSFKISFTTGNAQLAQEVTSRLTSLFISQNLETRERQATTTAKFLNEQLEAARAKLSEAEEQLSKFKIRHLGELPEQEQENVTVLGGLQAQLQNTTASLSRAKEQRQYLESLAGYRSISLENELTRLVSERDNLLDRYTPEYPAVIKINRKIEQEDALLKMMRVPSTNSAKTAPSQRAALANTQDFDVGQLRSQMDANRLEVENLSKDEQQLKASIARYQRRLDQTPALEQQLTGILRNYELLKQNYADLLSKEMQSQLSADLEKRQEGQQFRLVDRASLPTVPTSPNRLKGGLLGTLAGLGLGFAVAFLVDIMDRSFHSEEDLSQRLAVPIVIGIPLLLTPEEEMGRLRRRRLEWIAGSVLTLGLFFTEMYEFYLYRHG